MASINRNDSDSTQSQLMKCGFFSVKAHLKYSLHTKPKEGNYILCRKLEMTGGSDGSCNMPICASLFCTE